MTKEEHLEKVVDVVRDVMHKWHHFQTLADKTRAIKGYIPDGNATVKHFEDKAEEHWRRIRPALRELQDAVDNM